eukprot:jgi/Psemu1/311768/fgenesh1_kg.828_\
MPSPTSTCDPLQTSFVFPITTGTDEKNTSGQTTNTGRHDGKIGTSTGIDKSTMTMQRKSLIQGALLLALCFEAISGFQQSALSRHSSSLATPLATRSSSSSSSNNSPVVRFLYDDNDFDATPRGGVDDLDPLPAQSIPKLKIPKPSLSLPELDFKETLKKVALLGVTVLAFVAIQKGGMILAETFTPELSEEQVRNFVLK